MKSKRILFRCIVLVLLGGIPMMACSQNSKKTDISVPSNAKAPYKPLEKNSNKKDNADKATVAKKQASGKRNKQVSAAPKKQTIQAKGTAQAKKGTSKAAASKQQQQKQKPNRPNAKKQQSQRYITLKSNIPFQALSIHNLAVEMEVHKRVTVEFPVM